jgi:hypothetical protein
MNALSISVSRRLRRVALVLAFVSALGACGGAEVLVIPLFTFGFTVTTSGKKIDLFLNPAEPGTAQGTFSTVTMQFGDGSPSVSYNGTWSSCTFQLQVADGSNPASPAAQRYDGRFDGPGAIVLTPTLADGSADSSRPALRLARAAPQGTTPPSFNC